MCWSYPHRTNKWHYTVTLLQYWDSPWWNPFTYPSGLPKEIFE